MVLVLDVQAEQESISGSFGNDYSLLGNKRFALLEHNRFHTVVKSTTDRHEVVFQVRHVLLIRLCLPPGCTFIRFTTNASFANAA